MSQSRLEIARSNLIKEWLNNLNEGDNFRIRLPNDIAGKISSNFEGLESYIEAIDSIFKENGCKWTFTIMPAVNDFVTRFNSLISKLSFNSDFDPKHSPKNMGECVDWRNKQNDAAENSSLIIFELQNLDLVQLGGSLETIRTGVFGTDECINKMIDLSTIDDESKTKCKDILSYIKIAELGGSTAMDENCWAEFIENIESCGPRVQWSDFGNLLGHLKGLVPLNISVKNEKEINAKDILKSWKMFHGKSGLKQQIEDGGGQAKKWRDSGFSIDEDEGDYSDLESDSDLRKEVYEKLKTVSKSGSTSLLCDPIKGLDYCIHFDLIKAILAKPPKEKAEEELKTKHSIIQLITQLPGSKPLYEYTGGDLHIDPHLISTEFARILNQYLDKNTASEKFDLKEELQQNPITIENLPDLNLKEDNFKNMEDVEKFIKSAKKYQSWKYEGYFWGKGEKIEEISLNTLDKTIDDEVLEAARKAINKMVEIRTNILSAEKMQTKFEEDEETGEYNPIVGPSGANSTLYRHLLISPLSAMYTHDPMLIEYVDSVSIVMKSMSEVKMNPDFMPELQGTKQRILENFYKIDSCQSDEHDELILGPLNPLAIWANVRYYQSMEQLLARLKTINYETEEEKQADEDGEEEEEDEDETKSSFSKLTIPARPLEGIDEEFARNMLMMGWKHNPRHGVVSLCEVLNRPRFSNPVIASTEIMPGLSGMIRYCELDKQGFEGDKNKWSKIFGDLHTNFPPIRENCTISVFTDSSAKNFLQAFATDVIKARKWKNTKVEIWTNKKVLNPLDGISDDEMIETILQNMYQTSLKITKNKTKNDWFAHIEATKPIIAILLDSSELDVRNTDQSGNLNGTDPARPSLKPTIDIGADSVTIKPIVVWSEEEVENSKYSDINAAILTEFSNWENPKEGLMHVGIDQKMTRGDVAKVMPNVAFFILNRARGDMFTDSSIVVRNYLNTSIQSQVELQLITRLYDPFQWNFKNAGCDNTIDTLRDSAKLTTSMISLAGEDSSSRIRAKGQYGGYIASEFFKDKIAKRMHGEEGDKVHTEIISVDDPEHMAWLGLKWNGSSRCDLLAISLIIRNNGNRKVMFNPIEVKCTPSLTASYKRKAISQSISTRDLLENLLSQESDLIRIPRLNLMADLIARKLIGRPSDQEDECKEFINGIWDVLTDSLGKKEDWEIIPYVVQVKPHNKKDEYTWRFETPSEGDPNFVVIYPKSEDEDTIETSTSSIENLDTYEESKSVEIHEQNDVTETSVQSDIEKVDNESNVEPESDSVNTGSVVDLSNLAIKLRKALTEHNIDYDIVDEEDFIVGPTVISARFTLQPGVKAAVVSKSLDDIAREMELTEVPIFDWIQNSKFLALNILRPDRELVLRKDLLSEFFEKHSQPLKPHELYFIAGKKIDGTLLNVNLSEQPHMLVAGSTNTGKSIFLKGIIHDLIKTHAPENLNLHIIDPKQMDFVRFKELNHVKSYSQTHDDALKSLQQIESEMDSRRQALGNAGVTSLKQYNSEIGNMPSCVIIIDEFRDLMDAASKPIREAMMHIVTRVAQIGRAVGVHLILATQRADAKAVEGSLKTNLMARACLRVPDIQASKMMIDNTDAVKLGDKGDMFFKSGNGEITRVQVPYIDNKWINDL